MTRFQVPVSSHYCKVLAIGRVAVLKSSQYKNILSTGRLSLVKVSQNQKLLSMTRFSVLEGSGSFPAPCAWATVTCGLEPV